MHAAAPTGFEAPSPPRVRFFDVTSDDLQVRRGMQMDTGMQRLMVTHEHGDTAPETPTLPVLAVGEV